MIDRTLFEWAPLAIALVGAAFIADWFVTLRGARAYRSIADRWAVDGSYEMNPAFERAIDRGAAFSPRFAGVVIIVCVILGAIRVLAGTLEDLVAWGVVTLGDAGLPAGGAIVLNGLGPIFFAVALGVLGLIQATNLMQHAANLAQFRALRDPTAVRGSIVVSRWLAYQQLAGTYARYAMLWLGLFILSEQAFFLGGVLGALRVAVRFRALSSKARSAATPPLVAA